LFATPECSRGENYAVELFAQAFGQSKARELLERVHQAQQVVPFDFLLDIDPPQAAGLLSEEHPQTIAIVLPTSTREPLPGSSLSSSRRSRLRLPSASP